MNAIAIVQLVEELLPLVQELFASQQGQAVFAKLGSFFSKHPVKVPSEAAVAAAIPVVPVEVPPAAPSA